MKRAHRQLIRAAALIGGALFGAGAASAAPLACDVVTPTECQVTTLKNLGAGGTFEVDRTLHIGSTGELRTAPGTALTLEIAGDLVIDVGGKITGHAAATGNSSGATIAITARGAVFLDGNGASGAVIAADQAPASCSGGTGGTIAITSTLASTSDSIVTQAGSRIGVNGRCSAGEIRISAPQGGIDIRGLVESASTLGGIGGKQPPGGGPITISASCDLTINDTGKVSSRGGDPGADLVHLGAGGDVLIIGLVESTGAGHAVPNNPKNHCSGSDRPDKPANATACVEIWAGKGIVIDGTGTNKGEINANTPAGGGIALGWIDIFARRNVTINGQGKGPYAANAGPYVVHTNQSVSNSTGGLVAVKSLKGAVSLSGQAIQADGPQTLGGKGGSIVIEAGGSGANPGAVDLGSSSVRARGANSGGGPQAGGTISVRSFSSRVLGVAPGELNASGGGGKPAPTPGSVALQGCDSVPPAVSYGGTGTPAAAILAAICGGKPVLPAYVAFPTSACDIPPPCTGASCPPCTGPDCPPPPCTGPDCPCTGNNCPPPPCTGPDCPCTGDNCPPPPCTGPDCPCTGDNCPPPPCTGPNCPCTGDNCPPPCTGPNCPCTGTNCPPPPCTGPSCQPYQYFCDKGSVQAVLDPATGRFPGNFGPDVVVDVRVDSLQAAVDAASDVNNDGYIIVGVIGRDGGVPGGTGQAEVEIGRAYAKPFALIGCGVTLVDPLSCNGKPVVTVASSATSPEFPVGSGVTIYIQDLTVTGSESAPGWSVKGDGRMLEGVGAAMNTHGIKVVGNGNKIRNSFVNGNLINGLVVNGNANTVEFVRATRNSSGDGIRVTGNNNTLNKNTGGDQDAGNGNDGIAVTGTGNLVKGNGAYANFANGIEVDGGTAAAPNIVKNNVAGGPQRGNVKVGLVVGGTGPGVGGIDDVVGNTAQSNLMMGINVTGSGHRLKDNASGGPGFQANMACQYWVVKNNWNATGNTKNLAPIPGANGSAFPNGCF